MKQFSSFSLTVTLLICCSHLSAKQIQTGGPVSAGTQITQNNPNTLYKSDKLIIKQLSTHIYQHISFLETKDFGKVSCNGMLVVNGNEAVIFDTPAGKESSSELIDFCKKRKYTIKAVIPTHFHEDCVGGAEKFIEIHIPIYASGATIALLKKKGRKFSAPLQAFNDSLSFSIGDKKVYVKYFGEGHTKDNVIGWFPEDKTVFGGCLIKETGATKGNLADANTGAWPATIRTLKQAYPQINIVIPGHGKSGGIELLDYTIRLFE